MAGDPKDEVLIEKARLETRLLAQQLTPSYRRRERFKTLISASGLIIALVTVIGGFLSVANWFLEQKKTRQVRDEERLDRALTMLADEIPGKRLAAVISLRSFTSENNDGLNTQVLLALSGRLALEFSTPVRNAIVLAIEDLDTKVMSAAVLNRGLQSLAETSRSVMQEGDIWRSRPGFIWQLEEEPKVGTRLKATAQSIVALLRKGARTNDLSGVYFGLSDLAGLDLSGISFDDAILAGSDFTGASLVGDSFNGADLDGTRFIRADLRKSKFTLSDGRGRFGPHRNYIESQMDRWQMKDFMLSMPDFSCSDLRNADFKGQPLFVILADDYRGPGPRGFVSQAPTFTGANLGGADLRYVRVLQIGAEDDYRMAFFGHEAQRVLGFFKAYAETIYQIDPERPLAPGVKKFSITLEGISDEFDGTNWRAALLPKAIREWLEDPDHHPSETPHVLPGEKPCEPRAKW
jgi:uncharacterized protein YjbI with pentapeptide repeats